MAGIREEGRGVCACEVSDMGSRWLLVASMALGLCVSASAMGREPWKRPETMPASAVFGADRLWEIHLRLAPEEWKAMEPGRGVRAGMPRILNPVAATQPTTREFVNGKKLPRPEQADGQKREGNSFGYQYVYVHADVEMDGEVFRNVGLRFKGNASYSVTGKGNKKPFKVDFNRYVKGQKFHGLSSIILNNNALDPSQIREAMSYWAYREAGVPAPRTAFAAVYLTVPGQFDREYLGVYTLLEDVNDDFLKNWFGSSKGLLLKPENARGWPYLGEKWANYEARYRPKSDVREKHARRLIELTRLIHEADDEEYSARIGDYLQVDEFTRYLATSLLLLNLDSLLITGHNFYLYVNPEDNKVYTLPWDMHLSFGSFGTVESDDGQADLSILQPYEGSNRVIDRLLAIDEVKNLYLGHMREFLGTFCTMAKMTEQMDMMQRTIGRAAEKAKGEGKKEVPATLPVRNSNNFLRQKADLKPIISKRIDSVVAQLDGKTEGYVPGPAISGRWRFLEAFVGRGGPAAVWAPALIKAVDADGDRKISQAELEDGVKGFFAAADKEKRGRVNERLIGAELQRILPPMPGARGARAEARPATRPVVQPALTAAVARGVMREADRKRNGQVALEDLLVASRRVFAQADANKNGTLDVTETTAGIRRLLQPQAAR